MAIAFDGTRVPTTITTDCGTATFDYGAGHGYRCDTCNAVLGSIGMPKRCYNTYKVKQKLRETNPNAGKQS